MNLNTDPQLLKEIFTLDSEDNYEQQLAQQCFNIVGVFIAAIDVNGKITLINNKGRELLGCNEEQVIGKSFIDHFITKTGRKDTSLFFQELIKEKALQPKTTKYSLQTSNNGARIIEAKNNIIYDKNHNVIGILISGEDITGYIHHQDELQKDINLYKLLANNVPGINLFLFDTKLNFIITEGNEMKNNGLNKEDFTGKNLNDISNKTLRDVWEPLFKSVVKGKEISTEYKIDGYYYLIWLIPLKNNLGKVHSGIAITQNITNEKETENKLKKTIREAEDANKTKSDFLARVSHEIRTPLNAIIGFTEQLLKTQLGPTQEEHLKIIEKSSEHLLSLINDVLVLSKIEASEINLDNTPFKLEYSVQYVHSSLQQKAKEKNLRFTYDIDPKLDMVLIGDSFRLRQILLNMLSNAIKFTQKGYVELRCFLSSSSGDNISVRFDIIDTGIGIPTAKLEDIFDKFKQADSEITKKYGGTGLGLTICKHLIKLQKGELSVSSQEGLGTTFTFTIPFKKGSETDLLHHESGGINEDLLKHVNILLVDDDSVNRLLGKTILDKFNAKLDIANGGQEAIYKLQENTYDIILLDIHMPDVNGFDVIRFLRKNKKDSKTKVIALTAAVMGDDVKNYFAEGMNDFLIKPYKEINLYNKICELLQIKHTKSPKSKAEIIIKEEILPKSYNLEELKRIAGYDQEFINNMLQTFLQNSEQTIHDFNKELKRKNWKQIGEIAHKALPSFRHLQVESVIKKLTVIKVNSLIKNQYNELPKEVAGVIEEIKSISKILASEITK